MAELMRYVRSFLIYALIAISLSGLACDSSTFGNGGPGSAIATVAAVTGSSRFGEVMAFNAKDLTLSLLISAKVAQALSALGQFNARLNASAKAAKVARESVAGLAVTGGMLAGASAAIALPLKATAGAYIEEQAALAHVQTAMNDGAATMREMADVQQMITDVSNTSAISAVAAANSFYIAKSNMLSYNDSLLAVRASAQLTIGTTKDAADAQAQMEPTTRTLTTLYQNFGGSLSGLSDMLAKLQTQYAFADISEVTNSLTYVMPAALSAGVAIRDAATAMAELSKGGIHGAMGGVAVSELMSKLSTDAKLAGFAVRNAAGGLDLGASIQRLHDVFGGMDKITRARELTQLGFGEESIRGVALLIDKTNEYAGVYKDLGNAQGAAAAAAKIRGAATDEQLATAANQMENLKVAIGANLAPVLTGLVNKLGAFAVSATKFAETHKTFMKFAVYAAAGLAAVLALAGGIALLGAAIAAIASSGVALAVIGGIAVGITAIGAAVYFTINAWDSLKSYFSGWGTEVLGLLVAPFVALPLEIAKRIGAITSAASGVAHAIAGYFVGHSPIPQGPLRDLNLGRDISRSFHPSQVMIAARAAAAAIALSMPMAISPVASAGSMPMPARGGAMVNVVLNNTFNFSGVAAGDAAVIRQAVDEQIEKSGYRLVETVEREMRRRRRTDF